MKLLYIVGLLIAITITLLLGIAQKHYLLALFAASPYMLCIYLIHISKYQTASITAKVVAIFLVSVGLYFLLDTTYMERNLGYKFSFLFMPIWQWTMLLVAGAVVYLSNTPSAERIVK